MKNIRKFSDFLLKESQEYPQLPKEALPALINAIKSKANTAVQIYSTFREKFPNWLNELNNEASKEGTTVENILDDHSTFSQLERYSTGQFDRTKTEKIKSIVNSKEKILSGIM